MTKRKQPTSEIKEFVETVPKPLINRLRRIVEPQGKKGTWLRHLSDAQLAEIYFRLRMGQAAYALAKICQNQWGIMVQSQPQSLARSIRAFADKALGDSALAKINKGDPSENKAVAKIIDKKAQDIIDKCDGLKVMAWTVLSQQERVLVMMKNENELGFVSKQTDNAIKVLSEITDRYLKMQIELGIRDSRPSPQELHIHAHVKQMLGALPDVEREKMADVALKFVEQIEKKAITLQMDKDGAYRYTKAASEGSKNESDNECVPVKSN